MELDFDNSPRMPRAGRRPRRVACAAWWFEQMHLAVERATAWRPAVPPPRPEQCAFTLAPGKP
jgi:hypothetical protein